MHESDKQRLQYDFGLREKRSYNNMIKLGTSNLSLLIYCGA